MKNGDEIWELGIFMDFVSDFHDCNSIHEKNYFPNPEIIYSPFGGAVTINEEGNYISFNIDIVIEWLQGISDEEGDFVIKAHNLEKKIPNEVFREMYCNLEKTRNVNTILSCFGLQEIHFKETGGTIIVNEQDERGEI